MHNYIPAQKKPQIQEEPAVQRMYEATSNDLKCQSNSQQVVFIEQCGSADYQAGQVTAKTSLSKFPADSLVRIYSKFLKDVQKQANGQIVRVPHRFLTEGYGVILSKYLVITCAHNLIRNQQKTQQAYILADGQKIEVKNYRFMEKYLSENKEESRQNDIAVLLLKKPVLRRQFIRLGLMNDNRTKQIQIPKIQEGKVVYTLQRRAQYDEDTGKFIKYMIKTQKGESGSPILLAEDRESLIYYIVGLHTTGVFKDGININNQGVIFDKQNIAAIFGFEEQLVSSPLDRMINNNLRQLDKQEHSGSEYAQMVAFQQLSEQDDKKYQVSFDMLREALKGRSQKNAYVKQFDQQAQRCYKPQYTQFLQFLGGIAWKSMEMRQKGINDYICKFKQRRKDKSCFSLTLIQSHILQLLQISHKSLNLKLSFNQRRRNLDRIYEVIRQFTIRDAFNQQISENQIVDIKKAGVYQFTHRQRFKILFRSLVDPESQSWFVIAGLDKNLESYFYNQFNKWDKARVNDSVSLSMQQQLNYHFTKQVRQFELRSDYMMIQSLNPKYIILQPFEQLTCIRDQLRKKNTLIVKYLLQDQPQLKIVISSKNRHYHNYGGMNLEDLSRFQSVFQNVQAQEIIKPFGEVLRSQYISTIGFYSHSSSRIDSLQTISELRNVCKLKMVVKNIIDQFVVLHDQQISVCCPIECNMVINLTNCQIAFFYLGHPKSLFNYLQSRFVWLDLITEYYPIQQIYQFQNQPRRFLKVDVWMLGKSLQRLLVNILASTFTENYFVSALLQLTESMIVKRITMKQAKRRLQQIMGYE